MTSNNSNFVWKSNIGSKIPGAGVIQQQNGSSSSGSAGKSGGTIKMSPGVPSAQLKGQAAILSSMQAMLQQQQRQNEIQLEKQRLELKQQLERQQSAATNSSTTIPSNDDAKKSRVIAKPKKKPTRKKLLEKQVEEEDDDEDEADAEADDDEEDDDEGEQSETTEDEDEESGEENDDDEEEDEEDDEESSISISETQSQMELATKQKTKPSKVVKASQSNPSPKKTQSSKQQQQQIRDSEKKTLLTQKGLKTVPSGSMSAPTAKISQQQQQQSSKKVRSKQQQQQQHPKKHSNAVSGSKSAPENNNVYHPPPPLVEVGPEMDEESVYPYISNTKLIPATAKEVLEMDRMTFGKTPSYLEQTAHVDKVVPGPSVIKQQQQQTTNSKIGDSASHSSKTSSKQATQRQPPKQQEKLYIEYTGHEAVEYDPETNSYGMLLDVFVTKKELKNIKRKMDVIIPARVLKEYAIKHLERTSQDFLMQNRCPPEHFFMDRWIIHETYLVKDITDNVPFVWGLYINNATLIQHNQIPWGIPYHEFVGKPSAVKQQQQHQQQSRDQSSSSSDIGSSKKIIHPSSSHGSLSSASTSTSSSSSTNKHSSLGTTQNGTEIEYPSSFLYISEFHSLDNHAQVYNPPLPLSNINHLLKQKTFCGNIFDPQTQLLTAAKYHITKMDQYTQKNINYFYLLCDSDPANALKTYSEEFRKIIAENDRQVVLEDGQLYYLDIPDYLMDLSASLLERHIQNPPWYTGFCEPLLFSFYILPPVPPGYLDSYPEDLSAERFDIMAMEDASKKQGNKSIGFSNVEDLVIPSSQLSDLSQRHSLPFRMGVRLFLKICPATPLENQQAGAKFLIAG